MTSWLLVVVLLVRNGISTFPHTVDHEKAFTQGYTALSKKSTTGYIPISDTSETFYWLFYSDTDAASKPILVWIQGQIGVTSLVGALVEFQPQWTEKFNILFVDAPIGVGFSKGPDMASSSEEIASQIFFFLNGFFGRHIELENKAVIIAGEDYAGHTIPLIANLASGGGCIKFQIAGIAVGNGHTHAPIQVVTKAESAIMFGLIDGECIPEARSHAWKASVLSVMGDSLGSLAERNSLEQVILNCSKGIDMANVTHIVNQSFVNNSFAQVQKWINDQSHLEAIGVKNGSYSVKNQAVYQSLTGDIMRVIWGHIPPVLEAGIPTLWYQGQLDWIDGVYSNEAWINALEWGGATKYRSTSRQSINGGYMRSYGPLNEAMIRGAGHLVLVDKPGEIRELYERVFLRDYNASATGNPPTRAYSPEMAINTAI
jgi:carboxypeptidase C (cathepsin A)